MFYVKILELEQCIQTECSTDYTSAATVCEGYLNTYFIFSKEMVETKCFFTVKFLNFLIAPCTQQKSHISIQKKLSFKINEKVENI